MGLGYLLKIPAVSDYIFQADFDGHIAKIIKKFSLPAERSEELNELINAVLDDVISSTDIPGLLEQAFGVDEPTAKLIAADLVGNALLPLAEYLPEVESSLTLLGGSVADYPDTRVKKDRHSGAIILKDLIAGLSLDLTDALIKRLLFLLEQFKTGQKTEASLKTFLIRSVNIGGLGLNEDQATALLFAVLPEIEGLFEVEKKGVSNEAAGVEGVEGVEGRTSAVGRRDQPLVTVSNDVRDDVANIAVETGQGPVETQESRPQTRLKAQTNVRTQTRLEPVPAPEPTNQIVVATSHEVAAEVPVINAPAKTTAPSVVPERRQERKIPKPEIDTGDLKLPAKKAAAVRKVTAGTQDSFATALALATENAAGILKQNKISEKIFADLAGKAIRGLRDIYQTRDIAERDWGLKGENLAALMQAIALGIDAYQSSAAARSTEAIQKKSTSTPDASNKAGMDRRFSGLTQATEDEVIAPAKAQLTVGSTAPTTIEGQRKMVDVISSSRLAGPIEQLGKMTPTEFRRLSSNASEAGEKIEDLLTALESTSYEERVKGVLAWRESPMNQLYLQIAAEALSQGLALPEISSRRRAAGQDSLSPAEMKALAMLNVKIRF